jgi:hypothetical protein
MVPISHKSKPSAGTISVALLGDVSLNGFWRKSGEFPFDTEITKFIASHDVVLLNLESPCEGENGENLAKSPRLCTTYQAIQSLEVLHPTICVIANNHIYDQLKDGFLRTRKAVLSLGAQTVGAGLTREESQKPARIDVGQCHLSIFAFVSPETNPCLPDDAQISLNWLELNRMFSDIQVEASKGRFVIVSLHWGVGGDKYPSPEQRKLARDIIDSGAHLIWGHHPHVIQGWETVRRAPIFYSLGNACFDDLPGDYGKWSKGGRESILVSLRLTVHGLVPNSIQIKRIIRKASDLQAFYARNNSYFQNLISPFRHKNYSCFFALYGIWRFLIRAFNYFFGTGRNPFKQTAMLLKRFSNVLKNVNKKRHPKSEIQCEEEL